MVMMRIDRLRKTVLPHAILGNALEIDIARD